MADSAKDPCGVCGRRVGANSARCGQCQKWVHKRCTGIKGKLKWDPQFKCPKCVMGTQAGGVGEEREELVIDGGQGGVVEGVRWWEEGGGGEMHRLLELGVRGQSSMSWDLF